MDIPLPRLYCRFQQQIAAGVRVRVSAPNALKTSRASLGLALERGRIRASSFVFSRGSPAGIACRFTTTQSYWS